MTVFFFNIQFMDLRVRNKQKQRRMTGGQQSLEFRDARAELKMLCSNKDARAIK